jgi:ubiquinone/menaquinone biosynthesis C-methylase UbiE
MRQQFDNAPYPRIPLETLPKNPKNLYIHSLVTANYRCSQRVIETEGKVILDAGCGTGYKCIELAIANPGARIVGIDLSEASVKLAQQRLDYHGIENVEFYAIALEDLPSLGLEFDYINNDEVLYLLSDPVAGLKAMRSVLKPDGILRTNFHSSLQRQSYLRAQKFFKLVGLMDGAPPEEDVELVRQTMRSVKDNVLTKAIAWRPYYETDDGVVLANYLLQGDKGWTIPQFFEAIRSADLAFISMVNWREWDLLHLFDNLEELPFSIMMSMSEKSVEEQLYLFELLHPANRLLDVWCGHEAATQPGLPIAEWSDDRWQQSKVHLHPLLRTNEFKQDLALCVTQLKSFQISNHLNLTEAPISIDSLSAGCLLPLLEAAQPMVTLVQRWLQIRPLNPVTLEPTSQEAAFNLVKQLLLPLEELGYVMLTDAN